MANVQVVQTPTKTAPGPDVVRRTLSSVEESREDQRWEFEVKHTFIHFGSPAKTLSVKTPPKTVPSNFAPEHAALAAERLRTPLASPGVSTPWTVHRGAASVAVGLPRCAAVGAPPLGAQPQGAPSTLLRLSDFLPSPAGLAVPPPPAMPAGNPQVAAADHHSAVVTTSGWQTYEATCCDASVPAPSSWPNFEAVPPLPGSGLALGAPPQGFPCQPTSPFGFEVATAPAAPPPVAPAPAALPPPPAAPVGRPCLGSAPVMTIAYDGSAVQYSEVQLACPVTTFPVLSATEVAPLSVAATSPMLPMGEQMVSFHLPPPSAQPVVSLSSTFPPPPPAVPAGSVLQCGGCSLAGGVLSVAPRLTTVPEVQEPAKRVSICAGHFPEPGQVAVPPPPPCQAPQPLQMHAQPQLPPQLLQREAAAVHAVSWQPWAV